MWIRVLMQNQLYGVSMWKMCRTLFILIENICIKTALSPMHEINQATDHQTWKLRSCGRWCCVSDSGGQVPLLRITTEKNHGKFWKVERVPVAILTVQSAPILRTGSIDQMISNRFRLMSQANLACHRSGAAVEVGELLSTRWPCVTLFTRCFMADYWFRVPNFYRQSQIYKTLSPAPSKYYLICSYYKTFLSVGSVSTTQCCTTVLKQGNQVWKHLNTTWHETVKNGLSVCVCLCVCVYVTNINSKAFVFLSWKRFLTIRIHIKMHGLSVVRSWLLRKES